MAITTSPPENDVCRISAELTTVVHAEGTRAVVALRGDSDLSTRAGLSEVVCKVIATTWGDVVIDLADATFIDSSFIGALSTGQQMFDGTGRQFSFRSPSRLAARVLDVFGLTHQIEAQPSATPQEQTG